MIDNKNKKIYKEFYFNLELFIYGKKKNIISYILLKTLLT